MTMAQEEKKIPLLILAGPTASGKTSLSVELAGKLDAEIISADSMQVYRGMDIGTAKVTREEMGGIPHHLIDICDPIVYSQEEEWNVMRFVNEAQEAIRDISSRGRLPMLVGGTGFYIHALAYGAEFEEEPGDSGIRSRLEALSTDELFERLRTNDPLSAERIHPNNRKRVIRALEYYEMNGAPISEMNDRLKEKESPYRLCYLVLDMPRAKLYERIDLRVDQMIEQGLVREVESLREKGATSDMVSMKGLGYKEILSYLNGEMTLEEAIYILKRDTRHFAKRQLTWWRGEKDAIFLPVDPRETLCERALEKICCCLEIQE